MSNNKTLGQRIRELREEKEMSLREFAQRLELSPAFVSDVELGRRYPTTDKLKEMAVVLGVKPKELEDYDPKPILEELKRVSLQIDPELGILMRGNLNSEEDYEAFKKFLKSRDNKK